MLRDTMLREVMTSTLTGALLLACGPVGGETMDGPDGPDDAGEATAASEGTAAADDRGSDDATGSTGTSGGDDDDDDDAESDGGPICVVGDPDSVGFCDFPPPPECGPGPFGCSRGEKCNDLQMCEPLPADPGGPGDTCSATDSGDDCDAGLTCAFAQEQPEGTCLPACSFERGCEEGSECTQLGPGDDVCLVACDPLTPSCTEGSACVLPRDGDPTAAQCSVPAPEVLEEGAECTPALTAAAQCGPGLLCSLVTLTCAVPCDSDAPPDECNCAPVYDELGECWRA